MTTTPDTDDTFECGACDAVVALADAHRAETMGDLDPATWQPLCCPDCGTRLETVFVGDR
jgi:hypothetical protein